MKNILKFATAALLICAICLNGAKVTVSAVGGIIRQAGEPRQDNEENAPRRYGGGAEPKYGDNTAPRKYRDNTTPGKNGDTAPKYGDDNTTPRKYGGNNAPKSGDNTTPRRYRAPHRYGDTPNGGDNTAPRRYGPRKYGDTPRRYGGNPEPKYDDDTAPRKFGGGDTAPKYGDEDGPKHYRYNSDGGEGRDARPFPRPPKGHGKWKRPPNPNATPKPVFNAEPQAAAAKAAYLMDYGSKKALFAQNENQRYPIASMCKIMSLILIYEKLGEGKFKEDDIITVSEQASAMGGSQVFLESGGKYRIGDLIKSIVVSSANDSTVAMAEHIAGSEEGFVVLMNKRAKDLGLFDTNFTNCTGLPRPGQYSSAKDCAMMLAELIKFDGYFKYSRIWMDKMSHAGGRETEMTNTNKLVRFYKGCDGGKTGYTSEAKHCVAATAKREDMRLISVIIGAESSKTRFGEASRLLNYGFANYQSVPIVKCDRPLSIELEVKGGKQKTLPLKAEENFSYLAKKFENINYGIEYNLPKNIAAPVKKGDVVGSLSVAVENQILKEINIIAACDIEKRTYLNALGDVIKQW